MFIKLRWQENLPTTIKIIDGTGTLCQELVLQDNFQKIDLGFLQRGEYMLQISNAIHRFTKKIKVNK